MQLIRTLCLAITCLLPVAVNAQSVQQSGNVTPGHSACWAITGVIYDCGLPAGSSILGSYTANDLVAVNGSGSLIDSGFSAVGTNNWVGLQNFNGGATAPTRTPGDNTTNVATTAFVGNALTDILNTPNTWTALQTFSGGAIVPTRVAGDNTTNAASTAFVQGAVGSGLGITHATISTTTIPSTINSFTTSGYTTAGDVGAGCFYVRGTISGPGAIQSADGAYWQLSLNNDGLSITCFGAKMDGTTVDDAAVQATITALGAGGTVLVPKGSTAWDAVAITVSNIKIQCSAPNSSIILANSATSTPLTLGGSSTATHLYVDQCAFYSKTTQSANPMVHMQNCGTCVLSHFVINNAFDGVYINGSNTFQAIISNGVSSGAVRRHFWVDGGADQYFDHVLTGKGANNQAQVGVLVTATGGFWMSDSDFVQSGNGVQISPAAGQAAEWGFVQNTALGDTGDASGGSTNAAGLLIQPAGGGVVYGWEFVNSWTSSNVYGVVIDTNGSTSKVDGIQFKNHRSLNNTADGVYIHGATPANVTNIEFDGLVAGNSTMSSGTFSGIHINAGITKVRLRGIVGQMVGLMNTQKYNILVDAGSGDYIDYSDMTLCGFTTAAVSDSSTGGHNIVRDNMCWNPIGVTGAITVGASPATICAAGSRETHYYAQSGTNTATVKLGSGSGPTVATLVAATVNTPAVVELGSNECVVVTWATTAPTYTKSVH